MSIDEVGKRPADEAQAPRRRPRRRSYALAAAGVLAAGAAAGVLAALPGASARVSPMAALTSALTRTSAHSYSFSVEESEHFGSRTLNSDVVSGAFDPQHHLGTELLTARSGRATQRAQIRFIDADLYTSVSPGSGFGEPWDETPAAASTAAQPGDLYSFVSDRPVSPTALTAVLRSPGATARAAGPVSGPGWSGTKYTFTALIGGGREAISGTAWVDQQGLIRRLLTVTTDKGLQATDKTLLTTDRDITFGGFGASVQATAPPASQTKDTSGEPYWGFYF